MPRLRDTRTGVVVDVDDVTAEALGSAFVGETDSAPARKRAARKTAAPEPEK